MQQYLTEIEGWFFYPECLYRKKQCLNLPYLNQSVFCSLFCSKKATAYASPVNDTEETSGKTLHRVWALDSRGRRTQQPKHGYCLSQTVMVGNGVLQKLSGLGSSYDLMAGSAKGSLPISGPALLSNRVEKRSSTPCSLCFPILQQ